MKSKVIFSLSITKRNLKNHSRGMFRVRANSEVPYRNRPKLVKIKKSGIKTFLKKLKNDVILML